MTKKKKQEPASAPQVPEIAQDLLNQVQAIRALATSYNLLDKAHLPHGYHKAIEESLAFLRSLHEQALSEALKHPDAHKIPEFQQFSQPQQNKE